MLRSETHRFNAANLMFTETSLLRTLSQQGFDAEQQTTGGTELSVMA